MTTKGRVQKHCAKLRADHCGRLEAWIANALIEDLRTIVKQRFVFDVGLFSKHVVQVTLVNAESGEK